MKLWLALRITFSTMLAAEQADVVIVAANAAGVAAAVAAGKSGAKVIVLVESAQIQSS